MSTASENLAADTQIWDEVIQPRTRLWNLNLKEVWKYRDLMMLFVKRDFSAQYKQTILGPVWHIVQPLLTSIVFLFIFTKVAAIKTDGIRPILFYMSGITIWNYFSACLTGTSSTFVSNAAIFGKVYFPRLVLPLSTVLSNMIRFAIQFSLLLAVMIWYGIQEKYFYFSVTWLLIPFLVLIMAGMGLGLGIVVSSLTTKYRDLNLLIGFGVQLLMYATPIAYPMSFIKGKSYGDIIRWNPLSPVVEAFRYAIFGTGRFDAAGLVYSLIFTLIMLFVGLLIFNKVEKSFMDTV